MTKLLFWHRLFFKQGLFLKKKTLFYAKLPVSKLTFFFQSHFCAVLVPLCFPLRKLEQKPDWRILRECSSLIFSPQIWWTCSCICHCTRKNGPNVYFFLRRARQKYTLLPFFWWSQRHLNHTICLLPFSSCDCDTRRWISAHTVTRVSDRTYEGNQCISLRRGCM